MELNGTTLGIYIAGEKVGEANPVTIPVDYKSDGWDEISLQNFKTTTWELELEQWEYTSEFEYYYRRGDVYYFRGNMGKIIVEPHGEHAKRLIRDAGFIRGQVYDVKFTV